ncbi:hypothetical protein [Bacillus sp. SM2101]|uniref:hypothetical protein n=1 Tax=Bacillus sp. SM2101 TaxID=2805366 RepID=UPI001BDEA67E|nr:hypothetical protein [Bacillus sp. SM2101]
MGKLLFTIMAVAAAISIWVYDLETYLQHKAHVNLRYALDHGVHDAALFVDSTKVSDGVIDFEEVESFQAFKDALIRNLPINSSLEPLHEYFFTDKIKIEQVMNIDHNYIDPNTGTEVTFPYVLEYLHTETQQRFNRIIFGPSVVYVIETQIIGEEDRFVDIAIQEYKMKN